MANIKTKIFEIEFPNPIWTAAGPTAADAAMLKRAADGGAGGLVTKTISVKPAKVPIPNITSPFAGSLLNAELWSEMEYQKFIDDELPKIKALGKPVIVSLGYSPEDFSILGRAVETSGCADAIEFSIHYVGKDVDNLIRTANALKNSTSLPIIAKFSPSIADLEAAVKALDKIVDGFAAINSVGPALDFDIETLQPYLGSADGRGWLSGRAILPIGLHFVAAISQLTDKPVIGVGGIRTVEDVVKYIMAGASAVQVCSLAVLKGQEVYGKLEEKLASWMEKHGYPDIESLRSIYHSQKKEKFYILGEGVQLHPQWISEKCTLCLICEKSCVHRAISFPNDIFQLEKEKCVSCGLCASLCPTDALKMKG